MARITRVSTEPSPTPASNTRTAGGLRMNMRELFGDAVRDLPFLAAGIDEQQIFLPVVEEAEIALRIAGLARRGRAAERGGRSSRHGGGRGGCRDMDGGISHALRMRPRDDRRALAKRRMRRHEAVDAVERVGGDAAAVAQPRRELAVVDRAAAEGRIRRARSGGNSRRFPEGVVARSWCDATA